MTTAHTLLAALDAEAGPLDYGAPSARLAALAERWTHYARPGCPHPGPRVATVGEHPVWCLPCALERGHLHRWLAGTACPSCGRYTGASTSRISVLQLDQSTTLLAVLCSACSNETESE